MIFEKIISAAFYILFFIIPLIVYPYTSELFEFNKIVVLYILTSIIIASFLADMVMKRKFEVRRTPLDIPLLLFLGSQGIATLISIDFRTSLLGYYGRFNGGFISLLCYAFLYWAFVSKMEKRNVILSLYSLFASSIIVSMYGIAQHFGIDKNIWVQDVQNRVFSSLGQPNWLAAWISALLPITWAFLLRQATDITIVKRYMSLVWLSLSTLLFITLLYTKSRSGILGLAIALVVFFIFLSLKVLKHQLHILFLKSFLASCLILFTISAVIGTPWTPSIMQGVKRQAPLVPEKSESTSLETGGTESGEIRKIVWKGAFEIWKNYPIFGTGPETFAFAYYQFKPLEHNYTSEWDYLYNKAHNEYLNFLATTGIVGITFYVFLIGVTVYTFMQLVKTNGDNSEILFAFLSSYLSILVTNFFGFSVVPVNILFFLLPAFAITFAAKTNTPVQYAPATRLQKISLFVITGIALFTLLKIGQYWYADTLYAKGLRANTEENYLEAQKALANAVTISPNESVFWDELQIADRNLAIALSENKQEEYAKKLAQQAVNESTRAMELSPANVNIKRNRAVMLIKLSGIDPNYLPEALSVLQKAVLQAPTDPKLQYSLAAMYYRLGQLDRAIEEMKKAVEMKKDYKDSRYALGLMYIDAKKPDKAKEQFEYILSTIDPNDQNVKKELEDIEKQ